MYFSEALNQSRIYQNNAILVARIVLWTIRPTARKHKRLECLEARIDNEF